MTRYPQQGQLAVPQLQAEASPQRTSGLDLVQQCEAIGSIPSTPKSKQPSKHVPAGEAQQKGSTHACTEGHLGCLTCMITQARPTRAQRQWGSPVPMAAHGPSLSSLRGLLHSISHAACPGPPGPQSSLSGVQRSGKPSTILSCRHNTQQCS